MLNYIILLIKYYPILTYVMIIYKYYEYLGYIRNIYNIFSYCIYKIIPIKKDKEIDEIYEIIMETEPGEYELILKDETGYVKYNEEKKVMNNYL